jgi:starvation-inducible DNA-binding protein
MKRTKKELCVKVNCGQSEKECKSMTKELGVLLANSYLLYTKTQNFHWNLEDRRFISLHLLFEKQYHELQDAIDMIAEKIRSLGFFAPATLKEMLQLSTLKEPAKKLSGDQMIKALLEDHEFLCRQLTKMITFAEKLDDLGTQDMLIERLRVHEKTAWFLRAHK